MRLRTLFTINSMVFLVFGLAALLAPEALISLYGGKYELQGAYAAKFWGGGLLGYAVLTWFGRNTEESEVRHAIILALFVTWTIAFILAIIAQLSGVYNTLGWANVILNLLFALAYGYFQIKT